MEWLMNFLRRMFGNTDTPDTQSETAASANGTSNHDADADTLDMLPTDEESLPADIRDELIDEDEDATIPDPPAERLDMTTDELEELDEDIPGVTTDKLTDLDDDVLDNVTTDKLDDRENTRKIADGATRPLPNEPNLDGQSSGHITFGQTSDQGMVRSNNQDAALSFFFTSDSVDEQPDFGVFIVADGMGGHIHGEKASAITARIAAANVMRTIYLPLLDGEDINDADRPTIAEALTAAIKKANQQVLQAVPEGGTTVTSAVILNNLAHIAHVGDSRAYLITDEHGIEQITRDHSLVQRLIELEQLTPEEALTHEQRNVLYRAIGQSEDLEVDTLTRRLPPGSHLLLCSDGLWGMMEEEDIINIVSDTPDPQMACDKLVAYANTQGGTDNITAVLLKMPVH